MAVGPDQFPQMNTVAGVRLGTACAGIKKPGRRDLVVMELDELSQAAAVFTKNAFCAAPVLLAKKHLENSSPRYLLINTGNANAGTGQQGLIDALQCCEALASLTQTSSDSVLPFSTGVIGEPLAVERLCAGLPSALADLHEDGWQDAAWGILTTDTRPKGSSTHFEWQGKTVNITGIAKGSGMIRPDMATMLAFIATDAQVSSEQLKTILSRAVDASFNRITVDGDTSTNDACLLVATGRSGVSVSEKEQQALFQQFSAAISEICIDLAQQIVSDGEGASKFVTVSIEQGGDTEECLQVAYTIAHSPLVKTALFASDPNWGRILAAVGRAGLEGLDVSLINIWLDEVCIVHNGGVASSYREENGQAVMSRDKIQIRVELGRGGCCESIWTTDLSHDYISINADYRS